MTENRPLFPPAMTPTGMAAHWDDAYSQGDTTRSWYQQRPDASLQMFDEAGVTPQDSVIDIGGGASVLVDALLKRGHADISVLDVSTAGLHLARHRLGADADRVQWLAQDLLTWQPPRKFRLWHDRAVFHFLTTGETKHRYRTVLQAGTSTVAVAVLGTFAPGGPTRCSGLPVARYSPAELTKEMGPDWELIGTDSEDHHTPGGTDQLFTWASFRRRR